jgi:hypothetical protein
MLKKTKEKWSIISTAVALNGLGCCDKEHLSNGADKWCDVRSAVCACMLTIKQCIKTVICQVDTSTLTVGCSSPSISFTSVVLPLPFSPNKTTRLLDVKPKSAL